MQKNSSATRSYLTVNANTYAPLSNQTYWLLSPEIPVFSFKPHFAAWSMAVFKCLGAGVYEKDSTFKKANKKERLPIGQKFSHGVGHIYNDLTANAWFSYLIIFLTKVAGLSNFYAGLVILAGQITDATCTPFSGFLNDRTVNTYGRRKTWHLIGTVCSTLAFPLLFNRCPGCQDSSEAVKLTYYVICGCVLQLGWGCVQVSHLSLIPEISKSASERVELNAIRYVS